MAMIPGLKALFGEWIAAVARAVNSMIDRYVRRRQILLSEGGDNTFTAKVTPGRKGSALPDVSFRLSHGRPNPSLPADWQTTLRGSRVEVLLASRQVLFRSLDFPKQAVGFLDGMIRAQIDRLMPWAADDVVFGWSPPSAIANERVELTLAAMSKQDVQPLVQLATGLGAASVAAFAVLPGGERAPVKIKVFDRSRGRTGGRCAAHSARGFAVSRPCGRRLPDRCGLHREHSRCRAGTNTAPDFATPRVAPIRPECRGRVGLEPADETQADDAIQRHGA